MNIFMIGFKAKNQNKTILNVVIENICVNLSPIKNISNEENYRLKQLMINISISTHSLIYPGL